ncbi:MAG TPA: CTP synthase [Chitinispirillaceae bacterium]|jgi:CTP synthase|nr:CTP synthase [Chitinispirillaceae bacterium]
MPKFIFVTGGVVSSLGKGITAASIGLLLKSRGLHVVNQKFDPYLNVDPGTMNPYQHGEVYVTDDGAETDLDLGHYERFTGVTTSRYCNFTSGQIYDSIIKKERRGDFLGGTVQVVPHVTTEICESIRSVVAPGVDVVISEIGGTVGDIESLPYLEALRQFRIQAGRGNVLFIHVTLVPYLDKAGEVKTKPTQHSVAALREIGIIPDILICRTEKHLEKDVRRKLSLFCNVDEEAVIEALDAPNTIYEVPLEFAAQELDTVILDYLGLRAGRRDLKPWRDYVDRVTGAKNSVEIGVVGKYSELLDAYKSIHEALDHAGSVHSVKVKIRSISAEDIEKQGAEKILGGLDGVLVPGGFGSRGLDGKITAVRYARENRIPFLGICLGMQMAVIEFARNVLMLEQADSTENNPDTPHPVIHLMEEQKKVLNKGASMRLGSYPCVLKSGTSARQSYGMETINERHRHRYEFNNSYREQFEKAGMVISGESPDGMLVEIVEVSDHPWFVASQFHPEFKSRPVDPHPLFRDFVGACLKCENSASVNKG